jgi:glucose/arabinose dehydrogenase
MFISERPGRIRVVENGKLRAEPLATISDVSTGSESGLMGFALHPQFAENHLLYISYSYRAGEKQARVVRFRETSSGLTDRKVIIEGLPAADIHTGIRLRFGPDGKLYLTMGDTGRRELAQRLDSLAGKILRLNDDGTVPADNPFASQPGARPEIWSYGHRNPEGFDWQPGTNVMFDTDHGPSGFDGPGGGDEFNLVERGKNYGWPVIHHTETRDGMESPLLEYTPAVAPASGMFYRGAAFPEFRGN